MPDSDAPGTVQPRGAKYILTCLGIGLLAGLLSGLFGVGGGTVIVPLLVLILALQPATRGRNVACRDRAHGDRRRHLVRAQRLGRLDPGLILAAGAVVGAQIGTWLLPRVPLNVLRWSFIGFLVAVIVSLFLVIPSRDAGLPLTFLSIAGLVVLGVATGTVAGLIGVGGGIVVVPALMLLFGTSDLVAKGTSLLMMIPTAVSGTIGNLRRGNVDLPAAALIGVAACTTTALGAWIATLVDPFWGNVLFAIFLTFIAVQLARADAARAAPLTTEPGAVLGRMARCQ